MNLPDAVRNNPAAAVAALRGLALAALTLAVAFGLHVTPDQQSAILEFGGAVTAVALLFSTVTISTTVPKTPTASAPPQAMQAPPSDAEPRG